MKQLHLRITVRSKKLGLCVRVCRDICGEGVRAVSEAVWWKFNMEIPNSKSLCFSVSQAQGSVRTGSCAIQLLTQLLWDTGSV